MTHDPAIGRSAAPSLGLLLPSHRPWPTTRGPPSYPARKKFINSKTLLLIGPHSLLIIASP